MLELKNYQRILLSYETCILSLRLNQILFLINYFKTTSNCVYTLKFVILLLIMVIAFTETSTNKYLNRKKFSRFLFRILLSYLFFYQTVQNKYL